MCAGPSLIPTASVWVKEVIVIGEFIKGVLAFLIFGLGVCLYIQTVKNTDFSRFELSNFVMPALILSFAGTISFKLLD